MKADSINRAIILAAGRGSRMGALTSTQPKCMTELNGKSLLQWQLDALHGASIEQIALVRGYLANYFQLPLHYFDNPRWADTNMVSSLCCADAWLSQHHCIISYADLAYETGVVESLSRAEGDIVISYDPNWRQLWELRFENPLDDAETFRIDEQEQLLEIGQRAEHIEQIQGQYMGLIKTSPEGWQQIRSLLDKLPATDVDKLDMTSLLQRLISRGVRIQTVAIDSAWYEVDSEADLRSYERHCFGGNS